MESNKVNLTLNGSIIQVDKLWIHNSQDLALWFTKDSVDTCYSHLFTLEIIANSVVATAEQVCIDDHHRECRCEETGIIIPADPKCYMCSCSGRKCEQKYYEED